MTHAPGHRTSDPYAMNGPRDPHRGRYRSGVVRPLWGRLPDGRAYHDIRLPWVSWSWPGWTLDAGRARAGGVRDALLAEPWTPVTVGRQLRPLQYRIEGGPSGP